MASTEENTPSRVAQSELTSTRLRCCGLTSREQFIPEIPRILLNWNSFINRNGPKSLLTVVQVWSATTENVWLRLLLPKEGQAVIKSKASPTFPTLHCECLYGVFNKDMKTYNCLCVISLSRLSLSIVVTLMTIRSNFMTNLCINPGISQGFTCFFLSLHVSSWWSKNTCYIFRTHAVMSSIESGLGRI